ncbi:unnamed protein product [Amaranthus hypochondriacus]
MNNQQSEGELFQGKSNDLRFMEGDYLRSSTDQFRALESRTLEFEIKIQELISKLDKVLLFQLLTWTRIKHIVLWK